MLKLQRAKYQMFGRVKSFWAANRELFPEDSVAGKTFALLATLIASIDSQIVRQHDARSSARKVKGTTRDAVMRFMRAIASTGRRAARKESGPHPFRMPKRRTSPDILGAARLFRTEAERRKERFVELGMAPTFLTDFDAVITAFDDALVIQQDSRGARSMARAGIEAALAEGMTLVADLDVTVANALVDNPERLGQWTGARRVDYPGKSSARNRTRPSAEPAPTPDVAAPTPGASAITTQPAVAPRDAGAATAESDEMATPEREVLKTAS